MLINNLKAAKFDRANLMLPKVILLVIPSLVLFAVATPALAHHAMGGKMPANFLQGFLSGLAHPVIGLDHFAFIVAVGLLAVTKIRGIVVPITFILAAMAGTGIHLTGIDLPAVELFVSGSILLFGILLVMRNSLNKAAIAILAGIAGLFHGYAYGEAIFGAETAPLLAYLIGFTIVQLAIALAAFTIGKKWAENRNKDLPSLSQLRSAGFVICGIGSTFFFSQIIELIFPAV